MREERRKSEVRLLSRNRWEREASLSKCIWGDGNKELG